MIESQEDSDTKATILNHRYAMGFAGLGRIGFARQRMDMWLVELWGESLPKTLSMRWHRKLGKECEKVGYRGSHTFLATGFSASAESGLVPELVVISNSLTGDDRIVGRRAHKPYSFDVVRIGLDGHKYRMLSAGADMGSEVQRRLESRLRRWGGRSEIDSNKLVPELKNVLSTVSASSEGRVGSSGIVTSFPSSAVPLPDGLTFYMDSGIPAASSFAKEEVSFSFPAVDRPDDPRRYQPGRIGSIVMIAGCEAEFGRRTELGPLDHTMSDSAAAFQRPSGPGI